MNSIEVILLSQVITMPTMVTLVRTILFQWVLGRSTTKSTAMESYVNNKFIESTLKKFVNILKVEIYTPWVGDEKVQFLVMCFIKPRTIPLVVRLGKKITVFLFDFDETFGVLERCYTV